MLRPEKNDRDWYLFHMTPLGMHSEETPGTQSGRNGSGTAYGAVILTACAGFALILGLILSYIG